MVKRFLLILLALCLLVVMLPVSALAYNAYYINNAIVRADDFKSRPNNCRAYAEKMYEKIWGQGFSSSFSSGDNFLRDLEDEQLTLTAEHLKEYVSLAPLGATIRISSPRFLHRNDGNLGHSQVIVQKDDDGFTVLEGGLAAYPYYGENYYTWSDYVSLRWLGGKYDYIKYIKWPDAPSYYEGYGAEHPTVSTASIIMKDDMTGFTISYEAADDVDVENAYVLVWPQGSPEITAKVIPCAWDGETATAEVTCDTSSYIKNFYVRWCAVDRNGNVGGKDGTPRLVSFYEPSVNCLGYCKPKTEGAPVCNAPYMDFKGESTVKYTLNGKSRLSVTGITRNASGERWYQLSNGQWISEEYVRYDTFFSFLDWLYCDDENKEIIYMDGQVLFIGE